MESVIVKGSLWLETEAGRFFGPGRVELLQRIEQSGSINKAAKQMGMSYKKAWEMVQSMNSQAGTPFVLTQPGGEKGGGGADYARRPGLHSLLRRAKAALSGVSNAGIGGDLKNFSDETDVTIRRAFYF